MALDEKNFSPVGAQARAGSVPSLWTYTTPDTLATIKATGYFNALRNRVYKDDVVITITSNGGTAVLTIIFFLLVPRSPLTTDVTVVTVDISAA